VTNIFETGEYANCGFMLQLPYLNDDGNPRVIDITPGSAHQLFAAKTHRCLHAFTHSVTGKQWFPLTPIVAPAQNHVYQLGEEPV
jgi:hypothetical protein